MKHQPTDREIIYGALYFLDGFDAGSQQKDLDRLIENMMARLSQPEDVPLERVKAFFDRLEYECDLSDSGFTLPAAPETLREEFFAALYEKGEE